MTTKATLGLIIIIVLIGLAGWWYAMDKPTETPTTIQTTNTQSTSSESTSPATNTTVTNSSDASIDQSVNSIDTEMKGLDSDNANTDSGLNAQN